MADLRVGQGEEIDFVWTEQKKMYLGALTVCSELF